MAGPGGGPPRRSHTKSRKGCETCKKRHIRCDEVFPQCRNCTKHKIRCPYNDIAVPDDRSASPEKPDLMWTPEIEAAIEQWQRTGQFPFPDLNIYPTLLPRLYTVEELRLIYHVASISSRLGDYDANNFTIWTRQIPTLLKIAARFPYVMQALMAFSATHISYLTSCPLVGNMACVHRGIAFKGLQEAIGTFSKENSDAILATSLLLSWQATDWRSWTQLMQGTSTIIDAMDSWKHESQFGDFIAESSTFPTAPPSPTPDHRPSQPRKEDLDMLNRTCKQLEKLEAHLKASKEDTRPVSQLLQFVRGVRKVSPTLTVANQFERLRPLRNWLFYLPVQYLSQCGPAPSALITIAHYYAVALLMERLYPEIGAAYFGSQSIGPVEEIARQLMSMNTTRSAEGGLQTPLTLMEFPIDTVTEFRARMGWHQPARTPSFPQFNPPNFYMSQPSPPPTSMGYLPYGDNPAFSYSTEDLSLLPTDPVPNSAISPLALSSPYAHTQYLNIPSPSYGGAYSPASSSFGEGSVVYSEADDFQPFDMNALSSSAPAYGAHSNFGVGFVPPIQTVWI